MLYFLGNQGKNLFVFCLYSCQFSFLDCLFSFNGTQETNKSKNVITKYQTKLNKLTLLQIIANQSQNILSQK
jgi:hypothetical protein